MTPDENLPVRPDRQVEEGDLAIACQCPEWWFPEHSREKMRNIPELRGLFNHHFACPMHKRGVQSPRIQDLIEYREKYGVVMPAAHLLEHQKGLSDEELAKQRERVERMR